MLATPALPAWVVGVGGGSDRVVPLNVCGALLLVPLLLTRCRALDAAGLTIVSSVGGGKSIARLYTLTLIEATKRVTLDVGFAAGLFGDVGSVAAFFGGGVGIFVVDTPLPS